MAIGQGICWDYDSNDNSVGRFNQNPIMDEFLYEVEFRGEEHKDGGCMPSAM